MAEIVVRFADKVIERVVANQKQISIGRTTDNDIVLDNRGVSRRHALIEMGPSGQAVLIDNESLNGTFVDGELVRLRQLFGGEEVQIGETCFGFLLRGR